MLQSCRPPPAGHPPGEHERPGQEPAERAGAACGAAEGATDAPAVIARCARSTGARRILVQCSDLRGVQRAVVDADFVYEPLEGLIGCALAPPDVKREERLCCVMQLCWECFLFSRRKPQGGGRKAPQRPSTVSFEQKGRPIQNAVLPGKRAPAIERNGLPCRR
jgi:hypothetical protein